MPNNLAQCTVISPCRPASIVRALDQFPVTVFPSRLVLEGALEIALGTGRSVYDSVYVALAVALECPLVTADERLVNALAGGSLASYVLWVGQPEDHAR